jgi:uncharacterized protein DUF4231
LTLRVGIAGHRPDKLDATRASRVEERLPIVFAAVADAAKQTLAANSDCYAPAEPIIRLISGFAEGTDQIAVRLCPPSWQIEAILPFAKDVYLDSFADDARSTFGELLARAGTITELAPAKDDHPQRRDRDGRSHGYADAASYFLRQIDLLIVAWDGRTPRTGGTGAMARHAFDAGIPVVWIATEQDGVPRLIRGFDKRGHPDAPHLDAIKDPLILLLRSIFDAPSVATARGRLQDFWQETWPERSHLAVFDGLKRIANWQAPRRVIPFHAFDKRIDEWEKFLAEAPDTKNLRRRIDEVLLPRFLWADTLAVYFSHHYRSAYVLAYLMSALAVLVAIIGTFMPTTGTKALVVFIELIAIGVIIGMIRHGRRLRWHERWLDYRALAEGLRHGRFLAFVSEFGHAEKRGTDAGRPVSPWTHWYLRATMREVGLPTAALDSSYQLRLLKATMTYEVDEQIKYHDGNSKSVHAIDHMLHRAGSACFYLTAGVLLLFLLAAAAKLVVPSIDMPSHEGGTSPLGWFKLIIIFVSAGLPALGAALAGIRVQGDFEGSQLRSELTSEALKSLQREYRVAMDHELNLDETADMLIRTARLMSEDLDAWQDLYGRKRLTLPA